MDVVSAEASPGKGHLLILYPALFGKNLLFRTLLLPFQPRQRQRITNSSNLAMQGLQFVIAMDAIAYSAKDFFQTAGWLDDVPSSTDLRTSRGVFVCGVLFMALALGNIISTIATIVSKLKKSLKRSAKSSSFKKSN